MMITSVSDVLIATLSPTFFSGEVSPEHVEHKVDAQESKTFALLCKNNLRFHHETPLLQQKRKKLFSETQAHPWLIISYISSVASELMSLHEEFNPAAVFAQLKNQIFCEVTADKQSVWLAALDQGKRDLQYIEEMNKNIGRITQQKPISLLDLKQFVNELRKNAAIAGATFNLSEWIVNSWPQLLTSSTDRRDMIQQLEAAKNIGSSPV